MSEFFEYLAYLVWVCLFVISVSLKFLADQQEKRITDLENELVSFKGQTEVLLREALS